MYTYRITREATTPLPIENAETAHLQLTVVNHDNLFKVVEAVQSKNFIGTDKAAALALGLKLFSEVVLERPSEAPFAPMVEPLKQFIRELRAVPIKTRSFLLKGAGE